MTRILTVQRAGAEEVLELKARVLETCKEQKKEAVALKTRITIFHQEIMELTGDLEVRRDVISRLTRANYHQYLHGIELEAERQTLQNENQNLREKNCCISFFLVAILAVLASYVLNS